MIWVGKNIWKNKGTWQSFLSMDKIHLNQRMADFYGIKLPWDPNENSFAEMDAATLDRYGLHTHPYILASHSYLKRAHLFIGEFLPVARFLVALFDHPRKHFLSTTQTLTHHGR